MRELHRYRRPSRKGALPACFAKFVSAAVLLSLLVSGSFPVRGSDGGGLVMQKNPDGSVSADLFAMDTYMSMKAYGDSAEKAIEAAAEEIRRLDALLSTGREDSEISVLNREGEAVLSEDIYGLFERALEYGRESGGVFNPAVYPIVRLWGFPEKEYRVPAEEEIAEALKRTDQKRVETDPEKHLVRFAEDGMAADLGGIAKGYTGSRVIDIFRSHGVESGLVNLGGNVQTLGRKPGGAPWKVAIQDPEGGSEYLGVLEMSDMAMITSGGYERFFEEDGVRYHHIIDPSTGYPADSGVISSTIICADGTAADALSTSLFIMGEEKAEAFWREHGGDFDFVLETEDGTLYVTEGIADSFESRRKTVPVKAEG